MTKWERTKQLRQQRLVSADEKSLGFRMKYVRAKLGLTQEDLAFRLNLSPSTVANWERGATKPTPRELAAIATALSTTTQYLSATIGYTWNGGSVHDIIQ